MRNDQDEVVAPKLSSSRELSTKRNCAPYDLGRVRVVVRCRPLTGTEAGHTTTRLHIDGHSIVVNEGADDATGARKFRFDRVLTPEADQAECFAEVEPLIDHVLNGFHATVFAYGQTGSGKTHSMEGLRYSIAASPATRRRGDRVDGGVVAPDMEATPPEQHGVMPRAIQLLFDRARERQGNRATGVVDSEEDILQYSFKCSYFQIYNERITDLLRPAPSQGKRRAAEGLRLRWNTGDTFKVENLFLYECDSPDKMRDALFSGVKEKVMGSHLMNQQSSRSHCVFTIYIQCKNIRSGEVVSRAELSLVDLAGSEKLGQLSATPSAQLVKESIEINTSLLALGKVITALAQSRGSKAVNNMRSGHVPYRDSKLTKLLKHALGGNSITVMLVCVTPSDRYIEESVSTLLYAGRARNIENVPHVNEDPTLALIRQLRSEIVQLRQEVEYYRALATDSISRKVQSVEESAAPQSKAANAPVDASATNTITEEDRDAASATAAPADTSLITASTSRLQQADQLADSLLAACAMLQKIMHVNGQLRGAYEVVRDAKSASEQREIQLNAENIALRERIEVLESIVLTGDLADKADGITEESPSEECTRRSLKHLAASSAPPNHMQRALENTECVRSPRLAAGDEGRPEATEQGPTVSVRSSGHTAKLEHPITSLSSAESNANAEAPPASAALAKPRQSALATQKANVHRSRSRSHKAKKRVVRRLAEYESKYRAPARVETYADYYGRAQARVPQSNTANQTIKEMEEVLRKLPAEVVTDFVPRSLRAAGKFGALSFGGEKETVGEFEAKRKEREGRREALLKRQQELYLSVQQGIRGAGSQRETDNGTGSVDVDAVSADEHTMSRGPRTESSVSRIRSFQPLLQDSYHTITFDADLQHRVGAPLGSSSVRLPTKGPSPPLRSTTSSSTRAAGGGKRVPSSMQRLRDYLSLSQMEERSGAKRTAPSHAHTYR